MTMDKKETNIESYNDWSKRVYQGTEFEHIGEKQRAFDKHISDDHNDNTGG